MNKYKAELDRRRERGRLAQSAFRKRQTQAKHDMKRENAELKNAIAAILGETRADDRSALRARVREAAALAGLSPDAVDDGGNHSQGMSRSSWTTDLGKAPNSSPVGSESNVSSLLLDENSGGRSQAARPSQVRPFSRNKPSPTHWYEWLQETQQKSRMSIQRDPHQTHRCVDGSATILPFLGSGAFTFAGRIFWHLIERWEDGTPNYLTESRQSSALVAKPPLEFRDLLAQSRSLKGIEPGYWMAMVEAHFAYRRHEAASSPDSADGDLDIIDPASRDDTTPSWLSPISAEQRIRAVLGDHVFAALATPVLDRWENAARFHTQQDYTEPIDNLLDRLSGSYVCFGDGPRWHIETFDGALQDWCLAVIGTHAS